MKYDRRERKFGLWSFMLLGGKLFLQFSLLSIYCTSGHCKSLAPEWKKAAVGGFSYISTHLKK